VSVETHAGDPRLPRQVDEDLAAYMERYSKWLAGFRPWEQKAPAAIPEQRLPYPEEREAGCDDD
jgi:hypothetical protein